MGILSEAKAMSALTGKPLQDCKRARKALDTEIRAAIKERRGEDPAKVMCEVAFGALETAVGTATAKTPQPVAETKGMGEPDSQVQPPEPEKQVAPEPEEDPSEKTDVDLPFLDEAPAEPAPEKVTKKKTKKKRSRRSSS
jgi:outer membrane biosynthesis protein TonB